MVKERKIQEVYNFRPRFEFPSSTLFNLAILNSAVILPLSSPIFSNVKINRESSAGKCRILHMIVPFPQTLELKLIRFWLTPRLLREKFPVFKGDKRRLPPPPPPPPKKNSFDYVNAYCKIRNILGHIGLLQPITVFSVTLFVCLNSQMVSSFEYPNTVRGQHGT